MDFSSITDITIPQGDVIKIQDASNRVLWEKKQPVTPTIGALVGEYTGNGVYVSQGKFYNHGYPNNAHNYYDIKATNHIPNSALNQVSQITDNSGGRTPYYTPFHTFSKTIFRTITLTLYEQQTYQKLIINNLVRQTAPFDGVFCYDFSFSNGSVSFKVKDPEVLDSNPSTSKLITLRFSITHPSYGISESRAISLPYFCTETWLIQARWGHLTVN